MANIKPYENAYVTELTERTKKASAKVRSMRNYVEDPDNMCNPLYNEWVKDLYNMYQTARRNTKDFQKLYAERELEGITKMQEAEEAQDNDAYMMAFNEAFLNAAKLSKEMYETLGRATASLEMIDMIYLRFTLKNNPMMAVEPV